MVKLPVIGPGAFRANIMIDATGKEIMEKDIDYYFTDMDLHVTIRKEIIIPQKVNYREYDNDSVLSLSASTVFPRIGPAKLQSALLAIKNYAREFSQSADEMFLQCTEKTNQGDNESKNPDPELKTL